MARKWGVSMNTTICAISTAMGVGAISIIRCSGPKAISIVNSIFKGKNLEEVPSHTINYGYIFYNGEIIDEVLVSVMKAPKTFTTEDIVEINSHGGPAITNRILEILLLSGCTLADPGEFTKRAFLNGRIDLTQAEAVQDLVTSESEKSRKMAINQLTGSLSNQIISIRKEILDVQANIEVNIDYPEYEEGEKYTKETLLPKIEKINIMLTNLLNNAKNGKMIKSGINVALLGKPNVGKSSILNSFLEEEKAIVTPIAGTTRDVVEGRFILDGIILNIIDTAGIRKTDDVVEKIGVERSIKASEDADLIIYVVSSEDLLTSEDEEILKSLKGKNVILFVNKNDISDKKLSTDFVSDDYIIYGNTVTFEGLDNLKDKIRKMFNLSEIESSNYTFLSNARQLSLIKSANVKIENIINTIGDLPLDVFTIDLREAYELLGEIIGETYKEDLIDELFSKFCLGK